MVAETSESGKFVARGVHAPFPLTSVAELL